MNNFLLLVALIVISAAASVWLMSVVVFANDDSETNIGNSIKTFEDPDVDITFQYPSNWTVTNHMPFGLSIDISKHWTMGPRGETKDIGFSIDIVHLDTAADTPITTLKDFARHQYKDMTDPSMNVINDNQTIVGGKYPALQMEYTYQGVYNQVHALVIWTIDSDRNKGYEFTYNTDEDKFFENIPAIRKMLDSIEFTPLPPPPEFSTPEPPSFMEEEDEGSEGS
jgi:hypothetical protein